MLFKQYFLRSDAACKLCDRINAHRNEHFTHPALRVSRWRLMKSHFRSWFNARSFLFFAAAIIFVLFFLTLSPKRELRLIRIIKIDNLFMVYPNDTKNRVCNKKKTEHEERKISGLKIRNGNTHICATKLVRLSLSPYIHLWCSSRRDCGFIGFGVNIHHFVAWYRWCMDSMHRAKVARTCHFYKNDHFL